MLSVQAAEPMGPGVMGTFCCNWMMDRMQIIESESFSEDFDLRAYYDRCRSTIQICLSTLIFVEKVKIIWLFSKM